MGRINGILLLIAEPGDLMLYVAAVQGSYFSNGTPRTRSQIGTLCLLCSVTFVGKQGRLAEVIILPHRTIMGLQQLNNQYQGSHALELVH